LRVQERGAVLYTHLQTPIKDGNRYARSLNRPHFENNIFAAEAMERLQ
jgi:hypothetical protein